MIDLSLCRRIIMFHERLAFSDANHSGVSGVHVTGYQFPGIFVELINKGTRVPPKSFHHRVQYTTYYGLREPSISGREHQEFQDSCHRTQVSLLGVRVSKDTCPGTRETSIRLRDFGGLPSFRVTEHKIPCARGTNILRRGRRY